MTIVEAMNRYQEWGLSFVPLECNALGLNPICNEHAYCYVTLATPTSSPCFSMPLSRQRTDQGGS